MDRNRYAIVWEVLRCGLGLWFLYDQQDWFGGSQWLDSVKYVLGGYLVLSLVATGWFVLGHRREDEIKADIN
jgi:hypothetical protein